MPRIVECVPNFSEGRNKEVNRFKVVHDCACMHVTESSAPCIFYNALHKVFRDVLFQIYLNFTSNEDVVNVL